MVCVLQALYGSGNRRLTDSKNCNRKYRYVYHRKSTHQERHSNAGVKELKVNNLFTEPVMAPRKLSRAFLLFILFSNAVSAQQGEIHLPDTDIKSKGAKYRDQQDFYKAHTYFLEQNWDSALVYSMK